MSKCPKREKSIFNNSCSNSHLKMSNEDVDNKERKGKRVRPDMHCSSLRLYAAMSR